MSRATLFNWLTAVLVCLLLASAHLLDGPSEIEAAQDVAADVLDAQHSAREVARSTAQLMGLTGQQP